MQTCMQAMTGYTMTGSGASLYCIGSCHATYTADTVQRLLSFFYVQLSTYTADTVQRLLSFVLCIFVNMLAGCVKMM